MFKISRFKSLLVPNFKAAVLQKNYCYYLLLPEEPLDTAENNGLLRMAAGGAPEFDSLTSAQCYHGMGRISLDYEDGINHIEEQIKALRDEVSFANVLGSCDDLDTPLNIGWSTAKIMYTARMDTLSQGAYISLHERARKARVHKYRSLPIYEACKDILKKETLDESQERVVKKVLLEARLNGIELDVNNADGLQELITLCNRRKNTYKEKLSISNSQFRSEIKDKETVKDFPEDLLASMKKGDAEEPTWIVSLTPQVYDRFLEYCPRRSLRWNAWEAHSMRCSRALNELLDTSTEVLEIRDLRNRQAQFLGYKSYAEMSMETKMAGRLENVYNLMTVLMNAAIPRQTQDIEKLTEFARKTDGFLDKCLMPYDVPYYSRLQRDALFGNAEDLRPFFPLPHVLETLLMLSSRLFGVDFEEVGDPKGMWHQDVRYINILDSSTGDPIATLYLDLESRPDTKLVSALTPGGGYVIAQHSRSSLSRYPSVALVHSLPRPRDENTPSLLSLQDVTGLFQKFGEALQQLLTEVPYGEVSGSSNLEWDAVGTCGHFMANWVYVPSVLKSLTCHHETGQPISDEHVAAVIASANHMAAHKLCRHLYMSNLDLMLHESQSHWRTIAQELWPRYLPYPLEPKDQHGLSMLEWGESPGAVYYTGTWSRMVAADCTNAFLEKPEQEWDTVGKRYRETFLALGGACHSAEVFRKFRGRDPLPEYLISLYDINN